MPGRNRAGGITARIRDYLGRDPAFASFAGSGRLYSGQSRPFGTLTDAQWDHPDPDQRGAARTAAEDLTYDPVPCRFAIPPHRPICGRYGTPFVSVLVLRGANSDLLSAATARQMAARGPKPRIVEFAGVGHAPMLLHLINTLRSSSSCALKLEHACNAGDGSRQLHNDRGRRLSRLQSAVISRALGFHFVDVSCPFAASSRGPSGQSAGNGRQGGTMAPTSSSATRPAAQTHRRLRAATNQDSRWATRNASISPRNTGRRPPRSGPARAVRARLQPLGGEALGGGEGGADPRQRARDGVQAPSGQRGGTSGSPGRTGHGCPRSPLPAMHGTHSRQLLPCRMPRCRRERGTTPASHLRVARDRKINLGQSHPISPRRRPTGSPSGRCCWPLPIRMAFSPANCRSCCVTCRNMRTGPS